MADDANAHETPTRRDTIKYGGAVVAGGLLAGCAGQGDGGSTPTKTDTAADTPSDTETATSTEPETPTGTPAGTDENGSYSVTMEPMGEVTFESVPKTWMAYFTVYGDMGIALGQQDGLQGLIFTENWPLVFYDHLPGVDVSFDDVSQLFSDGGMDKEAFYDMDSDVHLMDPNFIKQVADGWETDDFEEVSTNIGPIFGNAIRRRNEEWHDYEYYSLYEAFGKIAKVFDERERYEAVKGVHDELINTVQADLPPREERPTVGFLSIASDFENGSFWAYPLNEGNGHKQYRNLGIRGAFTDVIDGGAVQWDYERILDVDPEILVFQYGLSHVSTEEFEDRKDRIREDPVGQQLTAVQNDQLYRGGTAYQGPVINLFQTEAAAKQFYPDTFGTWNGLETLSEEDERLFDYGRVADIINGDI